MSYSQLSGFAFGREHSHSSKSPTLESVLKIGKGKIRPERRRAQNSNLSFLPDLHSLDLFKGQPVPGSIINPGGRRTCMAGDPLRDLDGAARIHVFGDARRTETVTTNSFQNPVGLCPFLDQLQDTPTIQASGFNRFTILAKGRKKRGTWICCQVRALKPKIDRFF